MCKKGVKLFGEFLTSTFPSKIVKKRFDKLKRLFAEILVKIKIQLQLKDDISVQFKALEFLSLTV